MDDFVMLALAVAWHARAAIISMPPSNSIRARDVNTTSTTSAYLSREKASSTESELIPETPRMALATVTVAPVTVTPSISTSCILPVRFLLTNS